MIDHPDFDMPKEAFSPDPLGRMKLYSGGGGSSAPSETTTISKSEPPAYVQPYSVQLMNRAGALSNAPHQQYPSSRIASLTGDHYNGLNMARSQALYGTPYYNAAQDSAQKTLRGDYKGPGLGNNPYIGKTTGDISIGQNALLGMDNPYLNSAINQAQGEVINQYRDVTTPQLAAMQRQAGAFGNTGLQQQQNQALSDLTKNMGDISNSMRMQDYNLQAQLGEGDLARQLSAAQSNQATSLADNLRNTTAGETQLNRQQDAFSAERENQMRALSLAPGFYDTDKQRAQTMLGVGDVSRDYTQSLYNQNYQDWLARQQQPYQNLDVLANAIRTSMGGGGSSVTSSPNAYQSNSTANALGGGLLGYGLTQGTPYAAAGALGGGLLGLWG